MKKKIVQFICLIPFLIIGIIIIENVYLTPYNTEMDLTIKNKLPTESQIEEEMSVSLNYYRLDKVDQPIGRGIQIFAKKVKSYYLVYSNNHGFLDNTLRLTTKEDIQGNMKLEIAKNKTELSRNYNDQPERSKLIKDNDKYTLYTIEYYGPEYEPYGYIKKDDCTVYYSFGIMEKESFESNLPNILETIEKLSDLIQ